MFLILHKFKTILIETKGQTNSVLVSTLGKMVCSPNGYSPKPSTYASQYEILLEDQDFT